MDVAGDFGKNPCREFSDLCAFLQTASPTQCVDKLLNLGSRGKKQLPDICPILDVGVEDPLPGKAVFP